MKKNTKVFFVCPDNEKPAGGVKQLYRQVDILNANGIDAYILHKNKGFRISWFKNNTKIQYNYLLFKEINYFNNYQGKKTIYSRINIFFINLIRLYCKLRNNKINSDSILVFPEIYGSKINLIFPKIPKVIFNQNCYYTFNNFHPLVPINLTPYDDINTLATIVASEDAENYIKYCFPKINLFRLRLGIDISKFYFSENKKKQIAFMPRKLSEDLNQVLSILQIRNNLKEWNLAPIESKSEDEVASALRDSAIFLSFNNREGFGLPPVEAMACGCVVIGYSGRGGNEYFKETFSYKVEDRDIIGFVKIIEKVILDFESNSEGLVAKCKKASEFVLENYSFQNEEQDVLRIWKSILE